MFFPRQPYSPWISGSWRSSAQRPGHVLPVHSVLPVAEGDDARTLAAALAASRSANVRVPVDPDEAFDAILRHRPDYAVHLDGRHGLEVLAACQDADEPPTTRHLVARLRGRSVVLQPLTPMTADELELVAAWCVPQPRSQSTTSGDT